VGEAEAEAEASSFCENVGAIIAVLAKACEIVISRAAGILSDSEAWRDIG